MHIEVQDPSWTVVANRKERPKCKREIGELS